MEHSSLRRAPPSVLCMLVPSACSALLSLQEIIENFKTDCEALAQGQYDDWQGAYGRLAGIVIGDQLTRCGVVNNWNGFQASRAYEGVLNHP